jgi:hypothetical protein
MKTERVSIEPTLSLVDWTEADRIFCQQREFLVPVDQPLVLVSQVQRSGGTLFASLLDGHPELHVHPRELHVGHPTKFDWPELDLDAGPDAWLELLREQNVARLFAAGFRNMRGQPPLPFTQAPSFVERLFRVLASERAVRTPREVFDTYFTASFNAWLDCQGLRDRPKKWVAGFAPRVAWGPSRGRFRRDYPTGRIISILRDPRAWYASASSFRERYGDFDEAMPLWMRGADEIQAAKAEAPGSVLVLTYEALVDDPAAVMRSAAAWLDLTWDPVLLEPTFNRQPIVANSSFGMRQPGVSGESKERWRTELSAEVLEREAMREAIARDAELRALADIN